MCMATLNSSVFAVVCVDWAVRGLGVFETSGKARLCFFWHICGEGSI